VRPRPASIPPPGAARLPETARLFIALWPPPAVRTALQRCSERWTWPAGARRVDERDLHLTLHFLGAVPRADVAALKVALALPCPAFTLELDRAELWHHGTAVLGAGAVPPALEALHAALGERLRGAGLRTETRPFRAHVTLARRALHATPPAEPPPVRWPVRTYVLVESRPSAAGAYRVLQRYGAAAAEPQAPPAAR
jgi:2'-5' RNA ligase